MNVSSYFDNEVMSDVTLKFSGRELKCHRFVLAAGSEYFKKMLSQRSGFAESKQTTIELKDDDPVAVELLVKSIYRLTYQVPKDTGYAPWKAHLLVMVTADKYLLPELKERAFFELSVLISETISGFGNIEEMVGAIATIPDFYQIDKRLQPMVASLRDDNIHLLLDNDSFKNYLLDDEYLTWHVIRYLADSKAKNEQPEAGQDLGDGAEKLYIRTCSFCSHRYIVDQCATMFSTKKCPSCRETTVVEDRVCWAPKLNRGHDKKQSPSTSKA